MSIPDQDIAAITVAPRVTPEMLKANIRDEVYFTAYQGAAHAFLQDTLEKNKGVTFSSEVGTRGSEATEGVPEELRLLTFCVLVLQNGFTVHGVSACASKENYNREIGERIAKENALNQIWPLMGYTLRNELHLQERAEHIFDELYS